MGLTEHAGAWTGENPAVSDDYVDDYAWRVHIESYLEGRGVIILTVPFVNIKGYKSKINWNIKGRVEQPPYWKIKVLGLDSDLTEEEIEKFIWNYTLTKLICQVLKGEPLPYLVRFRNQTSPELENFDSVFCRK